MPALTRLCETYQGPIKAFFRGAGCPRDDVDDLAQDFLVHLLHPDVLKTVDPDKGRFRSFLLVCLRHYWGQIQAHGRTIKMGGRIVHVPLDSGPDGPGVEVAHPGRRPDQAFDVGMDHAADAFDGEVAEILRGAESAGEDERVQVRRLHILEIADLAAGNPRRLDQDIAPLFHRLSLHVVDHVHLRDIGRHAENLRPESIEKIQREGRLVDFRPVVDAAA